MNADAKKCWFGWTEDCFASCFLLLLLFGVRSDLDFVVVGFEFEPISIIMDFE